MKLRFSLTRRNGRVVTMADFENAKDEDHDGCGTRAMVMSEDERRIRPITNPAMPWLLGFCLKVTRCIR